MHEVDGLPVDLGDAVLDAVDALLLGAPVEPVAPVVEEPLERRLFDPLFPADVVDPVGQARPVESLVQVGQDGVGHRHAERLDVGHPRSCHATRR